MLHSSEIYVQPGYDKIRYAESFKPTKVISVKLNMEEHHNEKSKNNESTSSSILSLYITGPLVDDVLEVNFNFQLTNDAFLSPNHKTYFNFSLGCLWNVQIQF